MGAGGSLSASAADATQAALTADNKYWSENKLQLSGRFKKRLELVLEFAKLFLPDQLFLQVGGHRLIVAELYIVATLAAGQCLEFSTVATEFSQWH